jgi:two-component system response regulator HydG
MTKHILAVDDDTAIVELLKARLNKRGFEVLTAPSGEEALDLLEEEDVDAVITDLNMPGMSGIELCERLVEIRPSVPVLVITSFGSLETAVAAIRAGAYDFITKPFEMEVLTLALERALRHRSLLEEVKRLRREAFDRPRFEEILGECPAMGRLFDMIGRVATSSASVLITGESGTGKELVARALHSASPRSGAPFVAINCAAMPETLLESELFGHEKGAFTDAKQARPGLFLEASGGTIFLDEIGDMPIGLQPKLLRALEERTVRPVGGKTEKPFDVRVVTATNRDLESAVEEGRFREDLFYRINVVLLHVPPLRDRGTDVLLLAEDFIRRFGEREGKAFTGIATSAADKLLAYPWPGNVRELRNSIERAVALAQFDKITPEDLPEKVRGYKSTHVLVASANPSELVTMEEVERRYISRVLQAVGGSRTRASQILGLDRTTLYRKIKRYGLLDKDDRIGS